MLFQFRIYELYKINHRGSIRFLLMIVFALIMFYYIKTSVFYYHTTSSLSSSSIVHDDQSLSWFLSANKFNDNLDRIKDKLQYAVLIDAGSSGSRVYIYVWPPHSGDLRQLLKIRLLRDNLGHDVYHSITPGLSSCSSNSSNATNYISPLLDFAAKHIPEKKHKETPLYILATAGMRLLDEQIQNSILNNLRMEIPKRYQFSFTPNNVQVISGKEEGIYSWISLNYLTGRFDHTFEKKPLVTIENDKKRWTRMSTVNMMEMGGASIQVAFEITSNDQYNQLKNQFSEGTFKSKVSEINLGCSEHDTNHQYRLFVSTFLTLGANAARNNYVHYLINQSTLNGKVHFHNSSLSTRETILFDPCLSIDSSETVNITNPLSTGTQYLYHLKGSGQFEECSEKLRQVIVKDALGWCMNTTCPFDELKKVIVPFSETDFYGLSEFWYSMNDIFRLGGQYSFESFRQSSSKYCSTSWLVTQDRYKRKLYPNADFKRLLYQCFKSAWMTSILHDGFRMPMNYQKFRSVSMINDEPVQWTLGALIYRTRFFPLRSIDNELHIQHVVNQHQSNLYLQYVLFALCMLAVIFCICIYLRRLQQMLNNTKNNQYFNYQKLPSDIETNSYARNNKHQSVFIDF